jgi:Ohr subfamily peroxiredoxin
MKVLYTAIVQAEGGREGRVQSLDSNLDVNLALPKELGGGGDAGSNPEQLLAAGWAACFQNAMHLVAKAQKVDLTDSSVTAEVDLGMTDDGGFQLAGRLLVSVPELDSETANKLVDRTHEVCPISKALDGNIEVDLTVE